MGHIKGFDHGTHKLQVKGEQLNPTFMPIAGFISVSDMGETVDTAHVRGTGNIIYGQTPGMVTPNDFTVEVLVSSFEDIMNLFNLDFLNKGLETLTFNFIRKMPNPLDVDASGAICSGCRLLSYSQGTSPGVEAATISMTFRPNKVLRNGVSAALSNVIRAL